MADSREIDRVRAIHAELDKAAARGSRGLRINLTVSGGALEYTAEEVRGWPGMKAAMARHLRALPTYQFTFYNLKRNAADGWGSDNVERCLGLARKNSEASDPVARGLYMTREMLDTCGGVTGLHGCGYCGKPEEHDGECVDVGDLRREARAPIVIPGYSAENPERTGPYGGNDTTHEAMLFARQKADDEMSGRRAALVANLEAEHASAAELGGLLHPLPTWSGRRAGRRKR